MGIIDKDDAGLLGGGGLAAIVATYAGLGILGITTAALGGAILGHKMLEYYNKKPAYSH